MSGKPWKTHCRCGARLAFSVEDVSDGRPADGADYWCSDPNPEKEPHDSGVVTYDLKKLENERPEIVFHSR